MDKWLIQDWAGNEIVDKLFDTFEAAEEYLDKLFEDRNEDYNDVRCDYTIYHYSYFNTRWNRR